MEQWRPLRDRKGRVFEGYRVSNQGRVRSYWTIGPKSAIGKKPRFRVQSKTAAGYLVLCLRQKRGKLVVLPVHQLVAFAFLGPPKKGLVVFHRNHKRDDNRLINLGYASVSWASIHAIKIKPRRPLAKLTPAKVRAIRASDLTAPQLAYHYGVEKKAIYNVKWRKTWRDVK